MNEKSSDEEKLHQLLESFVEELQRMPDVEVLAGESAADIRARATARLARATEEAGRRRLAAARTQVVVPLRARKPATVSVQEARSYIARVIQDRQYTLAARQLEEMPESEILRLYEQLRELDDQDSPPDDDAGPAR
jgi:hypothetical protein